MFMDSLAWVDRTYTTKHANENPSTLREMYYPNLKLYESTHPTATKVSASEHKNPYNAAMAFLWRFGRKALLSLAVYLATFIPYIGRFVLPAASFWTFNNAVGTPAAVVIFSSGLVLPKRYLVAFLQSYFSSRSLMRDLVRLSPLSSLLNPILSSPANLRVISSIPTSPASTTQSRKRKPGSMTAKACSTASPSPFSSWSKSPYSECWCMGSRRQVRRI